MQRGTYFAVCVRMHTTMISQMGACHLARRPRRETPYYGTRSGPCRGSARTLRAATRADLDSRRRRGGRMAGQRVSGGKGTHGESRGGRAAARGHEEEEEEEERKQRPGGDTAAAAHSPHGEPKSQRRPPPDPRVFSALYVTRRRPSLSLY
ncbi:unnamed protein product [Prorocentrum cordatum]|uniref:Uncharacterized protein n=1 Tax=Prorocentrum cordatum TaxID=2364126 RepID=A0ABN9V233_9DINO|nr:unnamed protein product [Polarella glacialis]